MSADSERRVLSDKSTNALLRTPESRSLGDKENAPVSLHGMETKGPPVVAGRKRSVDDIDDDQSNNVFYNDIPSSLSPKRRFKGFYIFDERGIQGMEATRKDAGITLLDAPHKTEQQQDSNSNVLQTNEGNNLHPDSSSISDTCTNQTVTRPGAVYPPEKENANSLAPSNEQHFETPSTIPTDPIAYKFFVNEKAALLRDRIQRAVKKLEQKQDMERRVSEFEAYPQRRAGPMDDPQQPSTSYDGESQSEPVEDDATPKAPKAATLLPAPDIGPRDRQSTPATSSAPSVAAAGDEPNTAGSPEQPNDNNHEETPTSPISHSTPPQPGENEEEPVIVERDACCSVEKMIAKANKRGEAVDGLLKLMKTTAEYDNLDILDGI